jgi:hypothetical protein
MLLSIAINWRIYFVRLVVSMLLDREQSLLFPRTPGKLNTWKGGTVRSLTCYMQVHVIVIFRHGESMANKNFNFNEFYSILCKLQQ